MMTYLFTSPISQTEAVTRHPHGHIRSIPVSRHMDHPMGVLRLSVQPIVNDIFNGQPLWAKTDQCRPP